MWREHVAITQVLRQPANSVIFVRRSRIVMLELVSAVGILDVGQHVVDARAREHDAGGKGRAGKSG